MFAPAAQSQNAFHASAGTYRAVGVETGVAAATPHRLIVMLFDAFNDAVTQVRSAMIRGDVAAKGKAVAHALRILGEGLKGSLDPAAGGKLATDLSDLYVYVAVRLTHANLHNDPNALDECVRLMEPVRQAWMAIGTSVEATRKVQ